MEISDNWISLNDGMTCQMISNICKRHGIKIEGEGR